MCTLIQEDEQNVTDTETRLVPVHPPGRPSRPLGRICQGECSGENTPCLPKQDTQLCPGSGSLCGSCRSQQAAAGPSPWHQVTHKGEETWRPSDWSSPSQEEAVWRPATGPQTSLSPAFRLSRCRLQAPPDAQHSPVQGASSSWDPPSTQHCAPGHSGPPSPTWEFAVQNRASDTQAGSPHKRCQNLWMDKLSFVHLF